MPVSVAKGARRGFLMAQEHYLPRSHFGPSCDGDFSRLKFSPNFILKILDFLFCNVSLTSKRAFVKPSILAVSFLLQNFNHIWLYCS
jgi:hypothetical protein